MKITFLGTGAGLPGKFRNVSSLALSFLEKRGTVWLFDCGEASQHQILHTAIRPRRIDKIFITHLHGDHIFGLPGLLSSRSFQGGDSPLTIYGPKGLKDYLQMSLKISETHLKYELEIVEVSPGIVFEDEEFIVRADKLDHRITSYGYRIQEKNRPGVLRADKLQAAGVRPGPLYREIKLGKDVETEDGQLIRAEDYLGPEQKGRIITVLGDTRICSAAYKLAEGADLLIHEATFNGQDAKLAKDYYHSTTLQAAKLAKDSGVKELVLTHISSRYDKNAVKDMLKETKKVFSNSKIAEDFKEISIPLKNAN